VTHQLQAYIAGPLFDPGERWFDEQIEQIVAAAGFRTFLPHRDAPKQDSIRAVREVFDCDRAAIDAADVVVANLNGITTDDGTAWELGYAFARGKCIIGVHDDWRRRFDDEVVNLMIECSLDHLVRSLDDLPAALALVPRTSP